MSDIAPVFSSEPQRRQAFVPSAHDKLTDFRRGFTLIELLIVLLILAVVAGIAVPSYVKALDRARNVQATSEIYEIQKTIMEYEILYGPLPDSLADLSQPPGLDPWGNPFQYTNLAVDNTPRLDSGGNPLNSGYDLYSQGKDEASQLSLTAQESLDDIVRANDGGYLGLASRYTPG